MFVFNETADAQVNSNLLVMDVQYIYRFLASLVGRFAPKNPNRSERRHVLRHEQLHAVDFWKIALPVHSLRLIIDFKTFQGQLQKYEVAQAD